MSNKRRKMLWVIPFLIILGTAQAQEDPAGKTKSDHKEIQKEIKVTIEEQEEGPQYTVVTTTTENGEKKTVKKTYDSLEEMEADTSLDIMRSSGEKGNISMSLGDKGSGFVVISSDEGDDFDFDISIDEDTEDMEWVEKSEEDGSKVIQLKGGRMMFINEDADSTGQAFSFYSSDGDSNRFVKKYEIRMSGDGEDTEHQIMEHKNVFVFRDDEGNLSMHQSGGEENVRVWVDEAGNRTMEKSVHISSGRKDFSTASIAPVHTGDEQFSAFNLTGLPELELKSLNYYPNPNEGEFTLAFTGAKKPVIVRILDLKGNLMMEEQVHEFDGNFNQVLNVKDFDKGTYLLQIFQQNKALNRKLTLE